MAPTLFQSAFSSFLLLSSFTLSNAHSHFHRRDVIAHSHLHRRGVVIPTQLPGGWTSKGCYTEGSSSRALTGASYNTNTAMTDESCITFCSGKGFIYAGTEYSAECCEWSFLSFFRAQNQPLSCIYCTTFLLCIMHDLLKSMYNRVEFN